MMGKKVLKKSLATVLAVALATNGNAIPVINNTVPVKAAVASSVTRPANATVFFDAEDEGASFNVQGYWDAYTQKLSNSYNNGLVLTSSTDGVISEDSVLRIDYETGTAVTYNQYGDSSVSYSDGSYTIVGWGGDFEPQTTKTKVTVKLKSGTSGVDLSTILTYITIRLYDNCGHAIQEVEANKMTLVSSPDNENGYYTYSFNIAEGSCSEAGHGVNDVLVKNQILQGMKFYFDRTTTQERGTLIVSDVTVTSNDVEVDFSPFTYDTNKYKYFLDGNTLPFLRLADGAGTSWSDALGTPSRTGTTAGYNISIGEGNCPWHLWTMSTSDGNIVDGTVNTGAGEDALMIKYNNNNGHTTYTKLTGTTDKSGQWLVMTVKGEDFDPAIAIDLIKDGAVVRDGIKITDFQESMEDDTKVTTTELASGYQTIYYYLGNSNNSFDSVSFDYSGVTDVDATSSKMYVTEIYLLGPKVAIEKTESVDGGEFTKATTTAHANSTITYNITVTNTGSVPIKNVTIEDAVPEGLTEVTPANDGVLENGIITWNITDLAVDKSVTLSFNAKVTSDFTGFINNTAVATEYDNDIATTDEEEIKSNTVSAKVQNTTQDSYVCFAEVGQKTDLPIALGQTEGTTTTTQTVTTEYPIEIPFTSNGGNSTKTIENVYIPEGATVTLTGPGGSFVIENIVIETQTITLDRDNLNSGAFSANGTLQYHCKNNSPENGLYDGVDCTGRISGFIDSSSITLNNINSYDSASVTINLEQIYNSSQTFTLTVSYPETVTVPDGNLHEDTFGDIPDSTSKGATIVTDAEGKNSGTISYTSTATGTDTFTIPVNVGGDTTNTKNVQVTVYNYKVNNAVYVLDYGLAVDLTKSDANNTNGLFKDAVLSIDGVDTMYSIRGLSQVKRNKDDVADATDYSDAYGSQELKELENWSGDVAIDGESITYTPTKFMDSVDSFYYGVQVTMNGATAPYNSSNATPVMEGEVKVMPANIVYYEDNFAKSGTDEADGTNGIIYSGSLEVETSVITSTGSNSESATETTTSVTTEDVAGEFTISDVYGEGWSAATTSTVTSTDTLELGNSENKIVVDPQHGINIYSVSITNTVTGKVHTINVANDYSKGIIVCDNDADKTDGNQVQLNSTGYIENTDRGYVTFVFDDEYYDIEAGTYTITVEFKTDRTTTVGATTIAVSYSGKIVTTTETVITNTATKDVAGEFTISNVYGEGWGATTTSTVTSTDTLELGNSENKIVVDPQHGINIYSVSITNTVTGKVHTINVANDYSKGIIVCDNDADKTDGNQVQLNSTGYIENTDRGYVTFVFDDEYYDIEAGTYTITVEFKTDRTTTVGATTIAVSYSGKVITSGTGSTTELETGNQSNSLDFQYGYDPAYANVSSSLSGGSAHNLSNKATATFKFTGTGFDIISRANRATGILIVNIYNVTADKLERVLVVNTYYENGDLYQIPVISWKNKDAVATKYEVQIVSYTGNGDNQNKTVYIDGIRIYNPIKSNTEAENQYSDINEKDAQIKEIKQLIFGEDFVFNYDDPISSTGGTNPTASLIKIVDENTGYFLSGKTTVEAYTKYDAPVIDGEGEVEGEVAPNITSDLMSYAVSGPNNELYLENGYGFGFKAIKQADTNTTIQIGVKRVSGDTPITLQYLTNSGWKDLATVSSATEIYYRLDTLSDIKVINEVVQGAAEGAAEVEKIVVALKVVADSGSILSMTNVKINNYNLESLSTMIQLSDNGKDVKNTGLNATNGKFATETDDKDGTYRSGKLLSLNFETVASVTSVADSSNTVTPETIELKCVDDSGNVTDAKVDIISTSYKIAEGKLKWTVKFKPGAATKGIAVIVYANNKEYSDTVIIEATKATTATGEEE